MAFTPIPSTAEIALRFLQDGQNVANVWHVQYETAPSVPLMQTIASTTILAWQDLLRPLCASTLQLLEVSVVDQSEEGGVAALLAPLTNNVGTASSPALPNALTVAVKKSTGRSGRSYRGRVYHIGLVEAQVTNNRLEPSIATSINTAYTGFLARYVAIDCVMVVASLQSNNLPRPLGVVTPIVGFSTDPVVDTQRRRGVGRGR